MTFERAPIDISLLEGCADPVAKPAEASDMQVGKLWQRDRSELRECKARHAALAAAAMVVR